MANEEHITILRLALLGESIEIWNDWRRDNPEIVPDLSKENLKAFPLEGANFENSNLSETDLREVDLEDANLREANLRCANLRDAFLGGADLTFANLTGTNLENVDFIDAILDSTNLTGANIKNADFTDRDLIDWLTTEQVKSAINWEEAKYSFDFKVKLGLEWPNFPLC